MQIRGTREDQGNWLRSHSEEIAEQDDPRKTGIEIAY